MPLYYQQNINDTTKLAVWKITEAASFFLQKVPLLTSVAHPHKQLQHLAGRYLLPFLFPDFPLELIEIADTRKPFLPGERFHFSISHSGDYAAAIVSSTTGVGIDVEMVTPRVDRIKHKFLHPEDLEKISHLKEDQLIAQLTLLWSAKEAMFKWWGKGDIDFSEVMRIQHVDYLQEGVMEAVFTKKDFQKNLQLPYRLTDGLSIVWVVA